MVDYVKALKGPIIGWIVVDILFLLMTFVDGIIGMLTPTTLAPLTLAFGVWAGSNIVRAKGNSFDIIIAGVIVGLVCAVLTFVGFGLFLGIAGIFPLSVFALGFNIAGAIIGGGFALSR